jgi:hypothetical protein
MKWAEANQAGARVPVATRAARRAAVVIADAGDGASLVVLDRCVAPGTGVRFCHRGLTWQIVAYRRSARAWIAHPVEQ